MTLTGAGLGEDRRVVMRENGGAVGHRDSLVTAWSMARQDAAGPAFRQVALAARVQLPGSKGSGLPGTKELKEGRGCSCLCSPCSVPDGPG